MRVAVTATEPSLEAEVDPRFARCPCFVIVETQDMRFEATDNPIAAAPSGAGIQAAEWLAQRGVQSVLTGQIGPQAAQTLAAAGIIVVTGCTGTVRGALEAFKREPSPSAQQRNATSQPRGEPSPTFGPPGSAPVGPGRGQGMGPGRGMGRGQGGGRGRGGGGRGQGGMGRGGGGGGGRGQGGMGRGGGGGGERGQGRGGGSGGGFDGGMGRGGATG